LAHSSIHTFSRSFRFRGCPWAIRTFSSLQRFSIGFRSGDWLVHSRTVRCFLRSHSLVALAVCFGSLSCWKTQLRPIFNALTEGRRLLAKISHYMAPSILPSIRCSRPVPFAEKHPQRMMLSWVVRSAQRITGGKLPAIQDTCSTRCHWKAKKIIKDNNHPSHPSHCLFTPLSSRRRGEYRWIKAGIERLKNNFYLKTIRLLNSHH
jgi:hypothetical protein